MATQNEPNRTKVLLILEDSEHAARIAPSFENKGMELSVIPITEGRIPTAYYNSYDAIIFEYSAGISSLIFDFLHDIESDIVTALVPVVIFSQNEDYNVASYLLAGAEAVLPDYGHTGEIADYIEALASRKRFERNDPATGLLTGAPLSAILESKCADNPRSWYFVVVKLLNLKPFNFIKGYDCGDRIMRDLAGIIRDNILKNGEFGDFAARMGPDSFCIVTETRKIDAICRSIMVNSQKAIRQHYSPFELMKGFVTIEGDNHIEEHDLCEVIAGAAQVPAQWNDNHAMLLDIASDLIIEVERQEADYLVISL